MSRTTHPALMVGDARKCVARFGYAPRVQGVPVLPPDASEAAWLAARRPMVTASEVSAVLGLSHYADGGSAFSLWWKKQPDWPGSPVTPNMHIGRKLEAVIGELWAEAHPEAGLWRPGAALWRSPVEEWLGATPDYLSVWPDHGLVRETNAVGGLTFDGAPITGVRVEPVECKSDEGGPGWGEPGTAEVPAHHLAQVVTQCIVLGVPRGRIMRLQGKRVTEYVIDVREHDGLVADIVTKGRAFHASLATGVAPDIDESEATARTLVELYPAFMAGTSEIISDDLARDYREAKAAVKAAKALESFATNRIREALGRADAQYAVTADGKRVAARSHYKRRGYVVAPAEIDQLKAVQ